MTAILEKSISISDLLNRIPKILVKPLSYQRNNHDLALEVTEVIENDLLWDDAETMEYDLAALFPLCAVSILNEDEDSGTLDIVFDFTYKKMSIYFQNIELV